MADELRRMTRAELLSLLVEERKKNEEYEQREKALQELSEKKDQEINRQKDHILQMQEKATNNTLKVGELEKAQEVLKTQLETSKNKQEELYQKNDRLRISLTEANAENKKLSEELKSAENSAYEKTQKIAELQKSAAHFQQELTQKSNQLIERSEKIEALEKEIAELNADNEALTLRNQESSERIDALQRDKQGLVDTVKALEAEKAAVSEAETVDEDTVRELNQTIEQERAENARLLAEIEELRTLLASEAAEEAEGEDPQNIVEQMKSSVFGQVSVFGSDNTRQERSSSPAEKINDPDLVSEASAKVSSIIKMAQQRAEQYLSEAKEESERQIRECNQMKAETLDKCRTLEKEKQRACESMIANVKQETDAVLNELYKRTRGISRSQDSLYQELLEKIIGLDVF